MGDTSQKEASPTEFWTEPLKQLTAMIVMATMVIRLPKAKTSKCVGLAAGPTVHSHTGLPAPQSDEPFGRDALSAQHILLFYTTGRYPAVPGPGGLRFSLSTASLPDESLPASNSQEPAAIASKAAR